MDWWNQTPYKKGAENIPRTPQERLASLETAVGALVDLVEKAEQSRKEEDEKLRRQIDGVAARLEEDIDRLATENKKCFQSLENSVGELREVGIKHTRAIDVISVKIGIICTGLGSVLGWVFNYIADKLK